MAAALGVGLEEGDVAISLGTSGTVFSVSDRHTTDVSGAVAGFADATGNYLPLVCTLNATKVTDMVGRLLGLSTAELDRKTLEAAPGAGGVVMVPYLDGERTPNLPNATGSLTGLRSDTDATQVARAAFEGVVCSMLDALDALERVGVRTRSGRLFLVGGGARSAAYRRIVADLAQRPLVIPPAGEHVARGACVQAAAVLRSCSLGEVMTAWSTSDDEVVDPDTSVDADAVRAAYRARTEGAT
jgi:xylulokinase